MRKGIYFLLWMIISVSPMLAQNPVFKFYGEKNNNVVSLAWIPEIWPTSLDGVVIKRKEAKGPWQLVTPTPVVPSSFSGKDLTNIESQRSERLRLGDKLDSMIANNQAKPVSKKEYLEEILPNPTSQSGIAFIFALDYDLILLNGFGCTDRNFKGGTDYTYGLFPVFSGIITDDPIAIYESPSEGKPNIELAMTSSVDVIGNNKKLRLHWQFDLEAYKTKKIKGFDIYQQESDGKSTKLNDNVIWITSKENPADLSYIVPFPETDVGFMAIPLSYFGTQGEGNRSHFSPAAYKIILPPPKLSSVIEEQQLILNWELDHSYDSLIEKFSILKKYKGADYVLLIDINSKTRDYVSTLESNGEQVLYRVIALTKTGKEIWSNEEVVTYKDLGHVPSPYDLKGVVISQDGKSYIELSWSYSSFDKQVAYRVFTDGPSGGLIYDSSYPKDLSTPFRIEVKKSRGQLYHFAVQARTLDRVTSALSNEIEVLAPSKVLPPVSITNLTVDNSEVQIAWHFAQGIADMKGFKILLDGEPILLEDSVRSDQRTVKLSGLTPGRHKVSIMAVTQFGLEGEPSPSKNIIIP